MKTIINTFNGITDSITAFLYGDNKIANKSFIVFAIISATLGLSAFFAMLSLIG